MKLTDAQKLVYLESSLSDGDLEKYEAWVLWCEKNEPETLPGYFGFSEKYQELDMKYYAAWKTQDYDSFADWYKTQPKETK